ncbi:MAG: hypothetical protein K0S30_738 [Clostridia bacterium]|jgi:hypothetical protein|nr:hypothetical protein [Clostridia bacterium]
MKSINDLIWDPNQDQNDKNSDSPVVVTPNVILLMCSGGVSCSAPIDHAYIACL